MEAEIIRHRGAERAVVALALKAGQILLENGGEIFRVEETVSRICDYYGMKSTSVFVLSNGIFITSGDDKEEYLAKVIQIPVNHANLSRVADVNQLSREITQGQYSIEEARLRLEEIEKQKEKPRWLQILAAGVSSACFSILFGGDAADFMCTFIVGILLYAYLVCIGKPYQSKIVRHILGGALITFLCLVCYHLNLGHHLEIMIIGDIILMVPGLAFTNGIRDIADGDYISGSVRMLDAVLVFFCIAVGVGFVIAAYSRLFGGAPL